MHVSILLAAKAPAISKVPTVSLVKARQNKNKNKNNNNKKKKKKNKNYNIHYKAYIQPVIHEVGNLVAFI